MAFSAKISGHYHQMLSLNLKKADNFFRESYPIVAFLFNNILGENGNVPLHFLIFAAHFW